MEFKGLDAILKLIHRLDNAKLVMTPAFSESFLQGQSNDGNRVKLYLPNQDQLQESLGNMPLNFVLVNGEHNALSFPQWPATPDIIPLENISGRWTTQMSYEIHGTRENGSEKTILLPFTIHMHTMGLPLPHSSPPQVSRSRSSKL
ncbi:hypothetical protein M231_05762 [Tremella mesenterica]|uniref:Uncharacterized protein n=1 Tax=Tremella mesenterica TaxID=5217 RepID=A0A4Q1BHC3_TREME|nr:hypothetical protein M231_05762 [Tremella mesenterica]